MSDVDIIDIDENNISEYSPGPTCFLNIKHEGAQVRVEWLKNRFKDGLKIKLILPEGEKKPAGFIEYISGENAWRAVTADGYLFVHCIWMHPNKNKNKGYASILLNECIKDAEKQGKAGVAVITSEGPFMAGKALFEKNGFAGLLRSE